MLTQITPRFAPQIDGLGDYARLLGIELERGFGLPSRFIVGDPARPAEPADARSPRVDVVRERSWSEMLRLLDGSRAVLLHYVCYGYHRRGIPFWLNKAIRAWKRAGADRKLFVVFHELWASGPPWKSEFYLEPLQRRLVKELHLLCDGAVTSAPAMLRVLESFAGGKTLLQQIPSAFPAVPLTDRRLHAGGPIRVIIFGQEAVRFRSIRAHENLLRQLCREDLLAHVSVVGRGAEGGDEPSDEIRFLRTFLPRERIRASKDVTPERGARLLADADLFLSFYPSALIGKSSGLMAGLACGCIPLLPEAANADPLRENSELLACDGTSRGIQRIIAMIRGAQLRSVAEAGWRWYAENAAWDVAGRRIYHHFHGDPVVASPP